MAVTTLSTPVYYGDLGEDISSFLDPEELSAISLLKRTLNLDVTIPGEFYETIVARIVGGEVTARRASYDVLYESASGPIRIEVKGSSAWTATLRFNGRDYSRDVFRYEVRRSHGKSDFIVLMGHHEWRLYCWLLPIEVVKPSSRWITICAPWSRLTTDQSRPSSGSGFDGYAIPPTQLLDTISCWRFHGVDAWIDHLRENQRDKRIEHYAENARRSYWRNLPKIQERRIAKREQLRGPTLPGILC